MPLLFWQLVPAIRNTHILLHSSELWSLVSIITINLIAVAINNYKWSLKIGRSFHATHLCGNYQHAGRFGENKTVVRVKEKYYYM